MKTRGLPRATAEKTNGFYVEILQKLYFFFAVIFKVNRIKGVASRRGFVSVFHENPRLATTNSKKNERVLYRKFTKTAVFFCWNL
jgi:hypothetical protein